MEDNILHSKELKSGYTIQLVLYTENDGPLVVKLVNSKGDFIGQTFVSLDNINEEMDVYSNGEYKIEAIQLAEIETKVANELGTKHKSESKSFANKWTSNRCIANTKLAKFL